MASTPDHSTELEHAAAQVDTKDQQLLHLESVLAELNLTSSLVFTECQRLVLERRLSCSTKELLERLLPYAAKQAQPRVSRFFVGAVGLGCSGNVYIGANIEFSGSPIWNAIHAEQCVIALLHAQRDALISIAINFAPCGHCRQFLNEQVNALAIHVSFQGGHYTLENLLPHSFGPKDLDIAVKMCQEDQLFSDDRISTWTTQILAAHPGVINAEIARAACLAMGKSFSPYTSSPCGVVLVTSTGRLFCGSYLECAAYNPSIGPMQSAYVQLYGARFSAAEVALILFVELDTAKFSHREAAASLSSTLFPGQPCYTCILNTLWFIAPYP